MRVDTLCPHCGGEAPQDLEHWLYSYPADALKKRDLYGGPGKGWIASRGSRIHADFVGNLPTVEKHCIKLSKQSKVVC